MPPPPVVFSHSRFFNMDCVNGAREHLSDGSVDLIITDPPYGIEADTFDAKHYNRDDSKVVGEYVDVPAAEYPEFSRAWVAEAARVLRPGGSAYFVVGYTPLRDTLNAIAQTDLVLINHLIWRFDFGVWTSRKFVSSHYHVLYLAKPGLRRTFNLESRFATSDRAQDGGSRNYQDRESVWMIPRENKVGEEKNRNELPSGLLQKMLSYSSNPGDLVCDFFMGGGSTAVNAIGMDRRFVGFEISVPTFESRVPLLANIRSGELLGLLRVPEISEPDSGEPWIESEMRRAGLRAEVLRLEGYDFHASVSLISTEFSRGHFSVRRVLRRFAADARVDVFPGGVSLDQLNMFE